MLTVHQLSMRFGAKILFQDVSLQFNPGNCYGLVGANGCGKSTFLKLLTGDLTPEAGTFQLPTRTTVGSLKQDHYLYEQELILNVVLRGRSLLWEALEQKKALLQQTDPFTAEECDTLTQLEKVIETQKGYLAEAEAAKLLEGLGIAKEWHTQPLARLSGGYKLRVLLAQVFFQQPDILALDEPTNHLDLASIKWLENYLRQFPGLLLVTSHDRHFLNAICSHIADVDYQTITIYKGSYEVFLAQKQANKEQKEQLLQKQERRKEDLQGFIDRFRAKATKARQAQSKMRLVEKLEEDQQALNLRPSSRLYPHFHFEPYRASSIKVLEVQQLNKAYGPKKVLEKISFEVERGERIAIVGPNGIGKSTLLDILTAESVADTGTFNWGFNTRVAYFPQEHSHLFKEESSLLDWLAQFDREVSSEQIRALLGKVLFSGNVVAQSVHSLSGGEKARLLLAKMMLQKPNVLVFDEPNNHLDMEAIDTLIAALKEWEGTLLFVSHNRYFVSHLANRVLEISASGVKSFKGSYAEYLEKQETDYLSTSLAQRPSLSASNANKQEQVTTYADQKRLKSLRAQLKKKITQIEEACQQLEKQLKILDDKLGSEGFYQQQSYTESQKWILEKQALENQLNQALEKWEQACLELQVSESEA